MQFQKFFGGEFWVKNLNTRERIPHRLVDYVVHDDGRRILRGEAALIAMWENLGADPTFEDLSVFQSYRHWLGPDRQHELDRLVRPHSAGTSSTSASCGRGGEEEEEKEAAVSTSKLQALFD